MSAWINALAALLFFSGTNDIWKSMENQTMIEEASSLERVYVVIESVHDEYVILETDSGKLTVPRVLFPENVIHEGVVLEWRVAHEEFERRTKESRERINRMRSMSER